MHAAKATATQNNWPKEPSSVKCIQRNGV